ncbi:protein INAPERTURATE POLLEN 1 homolog [Cryptomeria japonica]|uniref:protein INAPERTURATE POLLEN 1 homolog n=1 Tax=Cryptomeria japonica TaxID=3369 RepID=UPI0025ACAEDB|nr:protein INAPERTURATE POLLEN 1 homolog [Cryptomeria japonica]
MEAWYGQWIDTMKNLLVPQLQKAVEKGERKQVMGPVEQLHEHLEEYFKALEGAAEKDVLQVLSPAWRSAAEKPFLWIGDFHPALLITLAADSEGLSERVKKIHNVMTPMLQDLFNRLRNVQLGLGTALALDRSDALQEHLTELSCIFLDANRLRRNVVSHILSASDVSQAAHFLQGIAQLYISFRDPHLAESLKRCNF